MRIIHNSVQKGCYPLSGDRQQEHIFLAVSTRWQEVTCDMKDLRSSFWNPNLFASSVASVCTHPYPTTPEQGLALSGQVCRQRPPLTSICHAKCRESGVSGAHLPCGFTCCPEHHCCLGLSHRRRKSTHRGGLSLGGGEVSSALALLPVLTSHRLTQADPHVGQAEAF